MRRCDGNTGRTRAADATTVDFASRNAEAAPTRRLRNYDVSNTLTISARIENVLDSFLRMLSPAGDLATGVPGDDSAFVTGNAVAPRILDPQTLHDARSLHGRYRSLAAAADVRATDELLVSYRASRRIGEGCFG